MTSHTISNARISHDHKFPLLVFLPGMGLSRFSYTSLVEQFASSGYVVAAFDFANGGFMVLSDGKFHQSVQSDDEVNSSLLVKEWATDTLLLLNEILALRGESENAVFQDIKTQIDPYRLAVSGHSLGGAAALEVCQLDRRFHACIDLDGAPFGDVAKEGFGGSALVILSQPEYSDAELASRGRTREQWKAMGAKRLAVWRDSLSGPGDPSWVLSVRRTAHLSFSDAPFTMPATITEFGGEQIGPERGYRLLVSTIGEYLHREFLGDTFKIPELPEVVVLVTRP